MPARIRPRAPEASGPGVGVGVGVPRLLCGVPRGLACSPGPCPQDPAAPPAPPAPARVPQLPGRAPRMRSVSRAPAVPDPVATPTSSRLALCFPFPGACAPECPAAAPPNPMGAQCPTCTCGSCPPGLPAPSRMALASPGPAHPRVRSSQANPMGCTAPRVHLRLHPAATSHPHPRSALASPSLEARPLVCRRRPRSPQTHSVDAHATLSVFSV